VTGGAVRVGRAIALALARAGMDVAIGYHHSGAAAARTVRAIERLGARGAAMRADLGDARAARRLVAAAARALGGLDVLINNAAVFVRTPFATTSPRHFDRIVGLNLRGPFFCAQAAAALMKDGGHIVNIGDAGAGQAWPGYIPYTLSKSGVLALTRSLAAALAPRGIAVNCVSPGAVLRPVGFPRRRWAALTGGRADAVGEVAAAVVRFATCPPSLTGRIVNVDGGRAR
jgi:NAD(P)-dependent dehydrogenase (short-subunit alcohol dehydrogenase family)